MDGGYDDALSRTFSPRGDYIALTRVVQKRLWQEWKGFAPPGTCTLVPFDFSHVEEQAAQGGTRGENPHGCRFIAVCPTMRTPQDADWDREVVYECIWSLLCAVTKWNENCKDEERVGSLLMTPLATGVGRISAQKWASQALLAMRHFDEACSNEEEWSSLNWDKVSSVTDEVDTTHEL